MPRRRQDRAKLADRVATGRDANLRFTTAFCLSVWVRSEDPANQDLAADLEELLLTRADLYGFPLHTACVADDALLALFVTAVPGALSIELEVAARFDPTWAFPSVWQISEVFVEPTGSRADKIREVAAVAFEELVLAWKGQHRA